MKKYRRINGELVLVEVDEQKQRTDRVFNLFIFIFHNPMSMRELTEVFQVHERTIYRDFRKIKQANVIIHKKGTIFWISDDWNAKLLKQKQL